MSVVSYACALVITIAIEAVVAALLASRKRRPRVVATAVLANMLTHPLAMLAMLHLHASFGIEVFVFLAEWAAYELVGRERSWRALVIALVANLATTVFGLLYWF